MLTALTSASTTVWLDPGIYKSDDGCTMYVVEVDPHGPRLAIIEDYERGDSHEHTIDEFVQVWMPR